MLINVGDVDSYMSFVHFRMSCPTVFGTKTLPLTVTIIFRLIKGFNLFKSPSDRYTRQNNNCLFSMDTNIKCHGQSFFFTRLVLLLDNPNVNYKYITVPRTF